MKITHKFVILGLCLSSVACGGVDKKSEDAAEESCALLNDCGGALVDEDQCISDQLDEHQKFKDEYGSDCLDKFLDVQNCINDNFTCDFAEDAEDSPVLTTCLDVVLDAIDECGVDAFQGGTFDEDSDFEQEEGF
jgi:hypothetical protein